MAEQSTRVAFLEVDQSGFGFERRITGNPNMWRPQLFAVHQCTAERGDSGREVGNSYLLTLRQSCSSSDKNSPGCSFERYGLVLNRLSGNG